MGKGGVGEQVGAGIAGGGIGYGIQQLMANGSGSGGDVAYPRVLPDFQGDVNYMRDFSNSLKGMQAPVGAFTPSPGMTGAANVGNNHFSPGGTGSLGMGQLSNILSGNNLDPNSNPHLQQVIQTMQQAFGQTLGQGEDSINAQFQGSGQSVNSGARMNAMSNMGRNAMSDFSNSLGNQLFGQYNQGQNQITSALGMMNQPLSGANMASALGQQPGQEAVAGQQYGLNLASLPFQYLQKMMESAPVGYPQYQPYQPGFADYMMQGLGGAVGNLPLAFAAA